MRRLWPAGIQGRLLAFLLAAIAPVFVLGMATSIVLTISDAQTLRVQAASRELSRTAVAIDTAADAVRADVVFLASVPPVGGLIRVWANGGTDPVDNSTESHWLLRMHMLFEAVGKTKPVFDELWFLDRAGRRAAHVRLRSDHATGVSDSVTDRDRDREIFAETEKLGPGQLYVSRIALARIEGRVVSPHIPVYDIAAAAIDDAGRVQGVLVARVRFDEMLAATMRSRDPGVPALIVADQSGFYLYHGVSPDKTWGGPLDLNTGAGAKRDFADQWPAILSAQPGATTTRDGIVVTDVCHLGRAENSSLIVAAQLPNWSFGDIVSNSNIRKLTLFFSIFLAVVLAVAVWPVGRSIVGPIVGLADVVERFRKGDQTARATSVRGDEIGQLARAFNELAEEVVRSHSALEGDVRDRTAKLEQSRRAALSLLQDATAQRTAAEAAAASLAESDRAVRARAGWAQGLQYMGNDLIACTDIQELARLVALAPVTGLGAERAWVSRSGDGGRFEVLASSSPVLPGDFDPCACRPVHCPSAACLAAGREVTGDVLSRPPYDGCREAAERAGFRSCGTWLCRSSDGALLCAVTIRFRECGGESPVVGAAPLMDVFCRQVGIVWERILTEVNLRELAERLSRATEAAETANKAKSAFLANMSHELRTPLGAIIGFSELLDERLFGELTAKQAEYVQDIIESGRHLLTLINDVLDLSKIEAGKTELELSTFAIAPLLTGSLVMVREKCLKHGIQLSIDVPEAIHALRVTADERKLKQIMLNLLSNAANFSPDGSSITVRASQQNDDVIVSVVDTGIGVAFEYQQKLFDEFFQVDRGGQGKAPGTGLGLSIAKRFVEMHGGSIWVESEGLGKGSAFRFTVPVEPAVHDESADSRRWREAVE